MNYDFFFFILIQMYYFNLIINWKMEICVTLLVAVYQKKESEINQVPNLTLQQYFILLFFLTRLGYILNL